MHTTTPILTHRAALLAVALCALAATAFAADSGPVLPGGRFGFSYANFNGTSGVATPEGFAQRFAGGKHNPGVYTYWLGVGRDVRDLNPSGEYYKHINIVAIDRTQRGANGPQIEGRPDFDWIHANHPEWILRDTSGNALTLGGTDEVMDFGNDAYLDWVLNTFLPNQIFDAVDREPGRTICLQQDNGYFYRFNAQTCTIDRYNSADGVQSAWVHYLTRAKARWPNVKLIINSGALGYVSMATQMAAFQRIFSVCDGYYSESLTDRHTYWAGASTSGDYKRLNLRTTMALASWLGDNGKVFMPHDGLGDTTEPSQDDTNYSWAFFNLMRTGECQYYTKVTIDPTGQWVPRNYPEMDLALGQPLEDATETAPDVFRRRFERAITYVNLSDSPVSIALPAGVACTNSLGQAVASPLALASFGGLTVYHASMTAPPVIDSPTGPGVDAPSDPGGSSDHAGCGLGSGAALVIGLALGSRRRRI